MERRPALNASDASPQPVLLSARADLLKAPIHNPVDLFSDLAGGGQVKMSYHLSRKETAYGAASSWKNGGASAIGIVTIQSSP